MLERALEPASGVRAVEGDFRRGVQTHARGARLAIVGPELLALMAGSLLAMVAAGIALALGDVGGAIAMAAPLAAGAFGIAFTLWASATHGLMSSFR